jgi:predicted nucleic acid-binding protein
MVLVDTSVWIDHFNKIDSRLIELLENDVVVMHQYVSGELACGNIKNRDEILGLLSTLPEATKVTHDEILHFIDKHRLFGKGLGYIDVHLLASCVIDDVDLYTRDKQLSKVAKWLNVVRLY